jgi:hypothetical protein
MRLRLKLTIYILITAFPFRAFAQLGADTARTVDALFERYRPEAPGCAGFGVGAAGGADRDDSGHFTGKISRSTFSS